MKTQVKTWMDFAAWSPTPWTSDQPEPVPVMAAKARFLGAQTLQTQWNIQVRSSQGGRTCQPFVGSKNGNENFRQARSYNFRVKCVVFARNRKFAKLTH